MKRIVASIPCFALLTCLVIGVVSQRNELAKLQSEYDRTLSSLSGIGFDADAAPPQPPSQTGPFDNNGPSSELLRLRSEINRLAGQKRMLANVEQENQRLQLELRKKPTSAPGSIPLPPGYIKKSEAEFAGYSSPEATIQSFLWAIKTKDFERLKQAFRPDLAESFDARIAQTQSADAIFKEAESLPGMRVVNQERISDQEIVVSIEVIPGDEPARVTFTKVNAEWKIAGGI